MKQSLKSETVTNWQVGNGDAIELLPSHSNNSKHSASKVSWQAQRLANIHGISLAYAALICSLTGKEGIAHG